MPVILSFADTTRVNAVEQIRIIFIFHIDCLVAVCQPLIKLLLTYLLIIRFISVQRVLTIRGKWTLPEEFWIII